MNGSWTIAGTAFKIYKKLLSTSKVNFSISNIIFPSAQDILPLALQKWNNGKILSIENINDLYLRNKIYF